MLKEVTVLGLSREPGCYSKLFSLGCDTIAETTDSLASPSTQNHAEQPQARSKNPPAARVKSIILGKDFH